MLLAMTFNSFAQIPSYVPQSGLKCYFSFEKGLFTGHDTDLVNNYDAMYHSATADTDRRGNLYGARRFDGNDSITTNYNGVLLDTSRTIAFWFYIDSFSMTIFDNRFVMGYGNDFNIGTYYGSFYINNSNQIATFGRHYGDAKWHLAVVTFERTATNNDFSLCKFYIDDTLYNVSPYHPIAIPKVYTQNSKKLLIGANGINVSNNFKGKLDDIMIWDRVLNRCELSNLYNETTDVVLAQPKNDTVNLLFDTAMFTVKANNAATAYQWQIWNGLVYDNLLNDTLYQGVTTDTLKIIRPKLGMNTTKYRCQIISCDTQYSNSATLNVKDNTSVSHIIENNLVFAPNPVTDYLNINSKETIRRICLYDMSGILVKSYRVDANSYRLDMSNEVRGMYIVRVNNKYSKSVLKQ